jgi:TRAP-type mannitol/chloroaromatic compound transport system substrate-binding protein
MTQPKKTGRRNLLKGAAVAAGAMSAPMVAVAQTTTLRFQSAWPAKDIFHEYANDYAKKVNDMAGSRLKVEVLPAGAVAGAFGLLDAVNKGTLDGCHGVVAYHYGKNTALALWGSGPAFGMDPSLVLSWHYYGGGKELLEEIYKSLNVDVISWLSGPMPTQPFGWFKKPVTKVEDMKGMKFRTVGLAVDMYAAQGAAVNPLPGGEIVAALDRGLIDGAEFNNASSDKALGFQDVSKVCMLQSYHQSGEQFEIMFNRTKFNSLAPELQNIIKYATEASSADFTWKAPHRNSQDYIELKKMGVKFYKTPDAILRNQLDAWDKIMTDKSKDNPLFKKVLDSQRAFAERAGRWQTDYMVDFKPAWNRYFGGKKA